MKKNFICLAFICFALAHLVACADDGDNGVFAANKTFSFEINSSNPDFILIHSKNVRSSVGTNELSAKNNERPQMTVSFSYDFSIEKHETTCESYTKLMASEFDNIFIPICDNDSLPITDVTYYDAILYANAASKKSNFDTVYSYSTAIFDNDGHCSNLKDLKFHPEINGFRLPLETEWMLVASQGWDVSNSWTSDNANGEIKFANRNKTKPDFAT